MTGSCELSKASVGFVKMQEVLQCIHTGSSRTQLLGGSYMWVLQLTRQIVRRFSVITESEHSSSAKTVSLHQQDEPSKVNWCTCKRGVSISYRGIC